MTEELAGGRSQRVQLPGGDFHYLSWGSEVSERPAMVLLHGITSSARSWIRVGPALAERYRVYALDMRGHGDSPKPGPGAYSLRQTADDAQAFIEALELEEPVIVGHSWGGATVLVLASGVDTERAAPRLAKIVLEDPACNFGRGNVEERAAGYTKDIGRPAAELWPELTANSPGWTEADIAGKIDALQKVSPEAVISVFKQGGQMGSLLPLLAKLTAPTLLIRADPNLGTTLDERAWSEALGYLQGIGGQAVQIDGASHNIHRSKYVEFMRAVDDFLGH